MSVNLKNVRSVILLMCVFLSAEAVAEIGRVCFTGRVGAKFDSLVRHRCTGAEARGMIYDETVKAFRTHFDDNHGSFDGWVTPEHGLWQGEYWGKNMLSLLAGAEYAGDETLKAFIIDKTRAFVKEFQRPDGSITSYSDVEYVVPTDPARQRMCWNLWGRKYTLWALVEVSKLSGDVFFLRTAERLYDQQVKMLRRLGLKLRDTGNFDGMPSLSVLKPLLLLYRATGKERYLVEAKGIVAEMDDSDSSNPPPNLVRNAFRNEPVWDWYPPVKGSLREHTKAYEMLSCYEGLVEYAVLTGERRPLAAAERVADSLYETERNVMGSVGFMDGFCNATRRMNGISEYCDVIHWIRLCDVLYRATGAPRHLDRLEEAFFNAGLAGFYRDGKWAMHGVRSHGYGHFRAPKQVGMSYHQCCVDNAPRLVKTIADIALVEEGDGRLDVNLYADLYAKLDGGTLVIAGNYPIGDVVTIRLLSVRPRPLRLRVPGWCKRMTVDNVVVQGPFFELSPATNRTCRLTFDMPPRLERFPAVDALKVGESERGLFERQDFLEAEIGSKEAARWATKVRQTPGARIVRGPLVLARTVIIGDTERDVFDFVPTVESDANLSLSPLASDAVWGAWTLRIATPSHTVETKVSDYATAADDAITTAFSVWF